jgi:peptidoglycan hydrolase CwlO-like protein
MFTRKIVATLATAGILAVGVGGVAFAQSTTTPHKSHQVDCSKAGKALAQLEKVKDRLQSRIDHLKDALQKAKDKGDQDLAGKIEARLDKVQKRLDRVNDRIQKIHQRCPAPAS